MYKKVSSVFLSALIGIGSQTMAQDLKQEMFEDLQFIANRFKTTYAPIDWKREYTGWDVDFKVEEAKSKIFAKENITVNDYQLILKDFLDSSKDYHVGYYFYHTENSSLPFTVKSAEGKYFVGYVDRTRLTENEFPFQPGDELVSFGGKSVAEAVAELYNQDEINVEDTDKAIAEMRLTSRNGASLVPVPNGPITVSGKLKGSDTVTSRQLIWKHNEEKIENHLTPPKYEKLTEDQQKLIDFVDVKMTANKDLLSLSGNPYGLGNRDSFLPKLGAVEWESDESSLFQAYSYKHPSGKKVGVIRIPSYSRDMMSMFYGNDINEFAEVLKKFQDATDALVIDQLNNPGGSVFYLYGLASMLTDQPLVTPRHEMTMSQEDIYSALEVANMPSGAPDDFTAEILSNIIGYPFTAQFVEFQKNYARFLINEWNAGKTRTSPYHIQGVDHINPSAKVQYTKPITILVNGLDFSGGDFFPAIMQDNKRATIFGTRTAGAGGYVTGMSYPNVFGLAFLSYTASIAERVNKEPIENLGVTPDVVVPFTANDLQNNYVDYVKAVNDHVAGLLKS